MSRMSISPAKDHFIQDGRPFFYLADTMWTAFSNVDVCEWEEYLDLRKSQGFNALQINMLTQWDGGKPDTGLYPFRVGPEGRFDYTARSEAYFERAREMVEAAHRKGFVCALVLLWGNYVPDTWMSHNNPMNVMPLDVVRAYTDYVVRKFAPYDPIYIISGDTDFRSEQAVAHYLAAAEVVKRVCPDALTTLHVGGGLSDIPEKLLDPAFFDFYMYQSSHNIESQDLAWKLAQDYCKKEIKKPVLNGEPCYEGHAFGGKYGRYNEFHVRKALWQSLLSGAKAGVTYGAQGVWGWYREGKEFANESYGGKPLPWKAGLRFKGPWEMGFAKWLFETFDLFGLEPYGGVLNDTEEIRMSVSADGGRIAVYAPYNADIKVAMDLGGYDLTLIDLANKLFIRPAVTVGGGGSVIHMQETISDALVIGVKR